MPRQLIRKELSNTKKHSPPAAGRAAEYVPREHSAAEAPLGVEALSSTGLKPGLVKRASASPLISSCLSRNYPSLKGAAATE